MGFLYGDSTPSPIEVNFIEFLRETVDFGVRVLQADQRILDQRERVAGLAQQAEATVARLDQLGGLVAASVERAAAEVRDPTVENCGTVIARAAADLVRGEVARIRSALASEGAKAETQASSERADTLHALEGLLMRHDLPETALRTHLRLLGGTRYGARLLGSTPFGLELVIELEVPPAHLFSHVVRVERVMERLEVMAPDPATRAHRGDARLRPQRLDKCYVAEFAIGVESGAIKLREAPEGVGAGFDLLLGGNGHRVRLVRVGEREEPLLPVAEVSETDAGKLRTLYERLAAPAAELTRHRRALADASLDGQSLKEYDRPAVLVDRLIQHIAPLVREIAARSLAPDELVLRRLLSEDRREEIFVTKAELARKLDPLPVALRGHFDPLGLGRASDEVPSAAMATRAYGSSSQPPRTRSGPAVAVGTIQIEPAVRPASPPAAPAPSGGEGPSGGSR